MPIATKRIYEPPARSDGLRVLVDGIWPRGVSRERAAIDCWLKEVAPSTALRRWYGHDPVRWPRFARRYREELEDHGEGLALLLKRARKGKVTLLYAARDERRHNAEVLRAYLEERLDAPDPRPG